MFDILLDGVIGVVYCKKCYFRKLSADFVNLFSQLLFSNKILSYYSVVEGELIIWMLKYTPIIYSNSPFGSQTKQTQYG